jgi:5-formyltetrahydrofolate cyclo-ligase
MAQTTGRRKENRQMTGDQQQAKASLRAQMTAELKNLAPLARTEASRQLRAVLAQQALWRNARAVLFYAPLADEPDIWPLLEDALAAGRTIALPRFQAEQGAYVACQITRTDSDLQPGRFGIREPRETCPIIPLNRLDLVLVPGVAFDLKGQRLGRGKGYYDRLLAIHDGPACGVAFDQQIVDQVPGGPHDVRLSAILTPTRWHEVTRPRAVLK